jgi:hypothetical protein
MKQPRRPNPLKNKKRRNRVMEGFEFRIPADLKTPDQISEMPNAVLHAAADFGIQKALREATPVEKVMVSIMIPVMLGVLRGQPMESIKAELEKELQRARREEEAIN